MKRLLAAASGCALVVAVPVIALAVDGREPAQPQPPEVVDVYADLRVEAPADEPLLDVAETSEYVDEGVSGEPVSAPSGVGCDQAVTADSLNAAFDAGVDSIVGADYQRAFELPDGRTLWVFQDAFVDDGAGSATLVHNAGLVQDGACYEALHGGSDAQPASWIAADTTARFQRWYWPLDGYLADDDTFVLFLAEMVEAGATYLDNATPVATWSVEIELDTLAVGPLERSPNPDDRLYGFEVTTDDDYLYLYAQCHRQFGFGLAGHDECASDVYVARQPLDRPRSQPLEYWTGDGWSRNSRAAVNIAPTTGPNGEPRDVNPMQIERDGDRWIAATLVGDWWGEHIYYDVAPSPEGPWTTTAVEPLPMGGGPEVASYFVSFVPSDEPGHTLAVSNNRWDGEFSEYYRPEFTTVPAATW